MHPACVQLIPAPRAADRPRFVFDYPARRDALASAWWLHVPAPTTVLGTLDALTVALNAAGRDWTTGGAVAGDSWRAWCEPFTPGEPHRAVHIELACLTLAAAAEVAQRAVDALSLTGPAVFGTLTPPVWSEAGHLVEPTPALAAARRLVSA
jgi:hypothetical protein